MTRDELDIAFDRWGSHVDAWPDEPRAAARRLLAADPGARERLDAARRLDAALTRVLAPPPAPAALAGRIAARLLEPPATARPPRPRRRLFPVWGGAAAVAASAVIGLWIGLEGLDPPTLDTTETTLAMADGTVFDAVVGPMLDDVVPEDQP